MPRQQLGRRLLTLRVPASVQSRTALIWFRRNGTDNRGDTLQISSTIETYCIILFIFVIMIGLKTMK